MIARPSRWATLREFALKYDFAAFAVVIAGTAALVEICK